MVPASSPIAVPAALDSAVDAAIAAVNAQVAAAEAELQKAPPAPPPPEEPAVQIPLIPFTIKGVLVTPETHLFENGVPLLTPTGRARLKPSALKEKKEALRIKTEARLAKAKAFAAQLAPAPLPSTAAIPATIQGNVAGPAVVPAVATTTPPVIKETVKSMTATVTTVYGKIGLPASKDEEIAVRTFVTNPAMVEIGYGLTLNIRNYESARIDVRVSLPCYVEETDQAFAFAKKWTEERIQTEVKEIRKIASGTKANTTPF